MRSISIILLFVISILTFQPAMVAGCMTANKTENCCKKEKKETKSCCSKKDKKSCKKDKEQGGCCGSGICCTMCACCLTAVVGNSMLFNAFTEDSKHFLAASEQHFLPGFIATPFQPPEFC